MAVLGVNCRDVVEFSNLAIPKSLATRAVIAMARRETCEPEVTAVVKYTTPSAITGDDQPSPGSSDFQATFSVSDQTSGVEVSGAFASALEPRNSVQSPKKETHSQRARWIISILTSLSLSGGNSRRAGQYDWFARRLPVGEVTAAGGVSLGLNLQARVFGAESSGPNVLG